MNSPGRRGRRAAAVGAKGGAMGRSHRPTRARVGAAAGYTLAEVLIVVLILGIGSALVIPQIGSTSVLRVQAAVRTLVADINLIQTDAMARQESRAIIFDVSTNSYKLVVVPGNSVEPTPENTIYTVDFNNGARFHDSKIIAANFDGDPVLIFDELGGPIVSPGTTMPSAGGTATITGSGSTFDVKIEPYTGRVTVERISGP